MFTKLSEKEMPKNIPFTYLFAIFVLFFSINSNSQEAVLEEKVVIEEASELSLEETLIIAVTDNPKVKNAFLNIKKADNSIWAIKKRVLRRERK